eukprot:g1441.t1
MEQVAIRHQIAQATAEKEQTKQKFEALKRAVDGHVQQLNAILDRPDVSFERLTSAIEVMDQELRSSELVPSALDTVPVDGTYEVLRSSLAETQKRCQAEANEELHNSLRSMKGTNRRLVEEVQKQTEELSHLTQQRLSEMEKLSRQEEVFSREKVSRRCGTCGAGFRDGQRSLKSEAQSMAHAFGQSLKQMERELLERISQEDQRMQAELTRLQDTEFQLQVKVNAERERPPRGRSRHRALAADLEALLARRDAEVAELQSKVDSAIASREAEENTARRERQALQERAEGLAQAKASKDLTPETFAQAEDEQRPFLLKDSVTKGFLAWWRDAVLQRHGSEAVYFVEVCGVTGQRGLMESTLQTFAEECEKLSDRSRYAYLQNDFGMMKPVWCLLEARTQLMRSGLEAPQWIWCLTGKLRLKVLPDERCEGGRLAPLAPLREPMGVFDEAGRPLWTVCEHQLSEIDLFASEWPESPGTHLDAFGPDLDRFPEAARLPKALEVLLLPGDVAVLPGGCWVQCYSDEASWALQSYYASLSGLDRILGALFAHAGASLEEVFGYESMPPESKVESALCAALGRASTRRPPAPAPDQPPERMPARCVVALHARGVGAVGSSCCAVPSVNSVETLRQQVKLSDEALAEAVKSNEALREQMEIQRIDAQSASERELRLWREKFQQHLEDQEAQHQVEQAELGWGMKAENLRGEPLPVGAARGAAANASNATGLVLKSMAGSCSVEDETKMTTLAGGNAANSFPGLLSACGKKHFSIWSGFNRGGYINCVQEKTGLSQGCSRCFAISASYGASNCKWACFWGSWCGKGCLNCVSKKNDEVKRCAGVAVPETEPSRRVLGASHQALRESLAEKSKAKESLQRDLSMWKGQQEIAAKMKAEVEKDFEHFKEEFLGRRLFERKEEHEALRKKQADLQTKKSALEEEVRKLEADLQAQDLQEAQRQQGLAELRREVLAEAERTKQKLQEVEASLTAAKAEARSGHALTSFDYNCLAWTCPAPRNEQQFRYSHFRDEDSCPHPRWWEPYRRRAMAAASSSLTWRPQASPESLQMPERDARDGRRSPFGAAAAARATHSAVLGPQTHRLPSKVMWSVTMLTASAVALMNFGMILAIKWLVGLKFSTMQRAIVESGVLHGILVLVLISTSYAVVGVCLIQFVAPSCGGSGIPENKAFLNGAQMPGLYSHRTCWVRAGTNILANAAGFPVGREGPMVTIGSNLAYLLCEKVLQPYVREWVTVAGSPALLVDEQRLAHATRISCTVGGACAIAVIFNAPFGGLLYMFEERYLDGDWVKLAVLGYQGKAQPSGYGNQSRRREKHTEQGK